MPVGQVGHADRRVGLVDLLAARARGAVGVDADVGLLDVDDDVVVDLRGDVHRREAGLAAGVLVEGADAHQPVHALLGLEEAVGVVAADDEGGLGDAGLLAGHHVGRLHRPALPLAVAGVHPVEHGGPVHGLDAAGPALHLDDGPGARRAGRRASAGTPAPATSRSAPSTAWRRLGAGALVAGPPRPARGAPGRRPARAAPGRAARPAPPAAPSPSAAPGPGRCRSRSPGPRPCARSRRPGRASGRRQRDPRSDSQAAGQVGEALGGGGGHG